AAARGADPPACSGSPTAGFPGGKPRSYSCSMSESSTLSRKPEGPPRIPGAKAVRPKSAATIIIVRRDGPKPRVLMGKRHGGHDFMPNLWVFPGGRIDRSDYRAPHATDLRPDVVGKFAKYLAPHKGRAL